jgi:NAD(P)-dependent dehydrogenase (short-subunit alcohol dehydrogenase family)
MGRIMALRLQNKIALVTGASKGIGKALAIGAAREGADVIVNYCRDRAGADQTAAAVHALGRRSLAIGADVGRVAHIRRLFDRVRREFDCLDCLINNAGITGFASLWDTTEEQWNEVFDVNAKGSFFCALEAARWMREVKRGGSIINVSTNCAALGVKNLVAYAASKAAIHGLTRQLAIELASDSIRVNTIAPGPTNVDRNLRDDPDYEREWGEVVPLGRTAAPEEMVGATVFLASDEASYVTGQVLYIDGGWSVQGKLPARNLERARRARR